MVLTYYLLKGKGSRNVIKTTSIQSWEFVEDEYSPPLPFDEDLYRNRVLRKKKIPWSI